MEFSCQSVDLCVKSGELTEGSFCIYADGQDIEGNIYSSDTRMRCLLEHINGKEIEVPYCFDGTKLEAGNQVKGEFTVICNQGEYVLPYHVTVQKTVLQTSMGIIKNLFHFTNLAKADWNEAVELFYSEDFESIFKQSDKSELAVYRGLSRWKGNQENVEEFLIAMNKKPPVTYELDIEGFMLDNIVDSTERELTITRSGWGYTNLEVRTDCDFIQLPAERIGSEDFVNNICHFAFTVDATRLHGGMNIGNIYIGNTCQSFDIPVTVMIDTSDSQSKARRIVMKARLDLMKAYIEMKCFSVTKELWIRKSEAAIDSMLELDEDNLEARLYKTQMLIERERFNEAKWYLELMDQQIFEKETDKVTKCYYLYLTTLFNRDEGYIQGVEDEIETSYANSQGDWRLAWIIMNMDEDYIRNPENRWHFLEEQFKLGCTSPALLIEAVHILHDKPSYLLKLEEFEQSVLWHAVKYNMVKQDLVEQIQYLAARVDKFSPLLFRVLTAIYNNNKSPQTIAAICNLLIIGDKHGKEYFEWYAKGVEKEVRVTKLYEYYMMSIEPAAVNNETPEIPRMVLMYFAYQSMLDYERNAYLYAYIVRNKEKYPDLEKSYRIAIERFVVDQIKLGHTNENLAYLYQNIIAPQMLRDDTVYAFTPLLFMHKITVENKDINSVVVLYDKMNGESIYPVENGESMIPIYGNEYSLFLQDTHGNRYVKRIPHVNKQLMTPDRLLQYLGGYMEGRLSFDIYLCEADKDCVAITADNVARFKSLTESEQVSDSFKKEIRTKLLHFYYDNDRIGELDIFLEETESETMDSEERAEFIRFLISRGMFDKAYNWMKEFGLSGVSLKSVARLVSRRIVTNQFTKEDFLINVSYYIYKNMRYDENILKYLMMYYEGKITELRNIWKAAVELELPVDAIMERMLRQMQLTHAIVPEKNDILLQYVEQPEYDTELARNLFVEAVYDYFVENAITCKEIFHKIYEKYRQTGKILRIQKLALLKFWSENEDELQDIPEETVSFFAEEFLNEDIIFPFYRKLSDVVPLLHYFKNRSFVEYKADTKSRVQIHYIYDESTLAKEGDFSDDNIDEEQYITEDMKDMFEGIFVKDFELLHGESVQYYITEYINGEEHVTESNTLSGDEQQAQEYRFGMLNDIMLSVEINDEQAMNELTEEYLRQDFLTRELFYVV